MSEDRILRPGANAWCVDRASRVAFLVDGAAYFAALGQAIARARQSVYVAAWEIDDEIPLEPGDEPGEATTLGGALRRRLRERRSLRAHVLAWDFAMVYAAERGLRPLFRLRFSKQRRLHFELDSCHPVGASHHQKLVVVDDRLAFVGGLDPAPRRWDTPDHRPREPARRHADGDPAAPFHDVQALVEGRAAARLGELFRERWQCATGDALEAPKGSEEAESPWPDGVRAELEDLDVAIARTRAAYDGVDEAREVERLYLDSIAAARRSLYIENQYLTSATVTRALAERLAEADGPDVVVVVPRRCEGWLEQGTVGLMRRRRLDELRRADRGGRLRVLYPHVPGVEDGVLVHSKLMVVDDALVTLGSANLSNRSMGFDSECNLAIESAGRDPRVADGLCGLRDRLLAEHLAVDERTVADAVSGAGGSLTKAVDALAGGPNRTLRPVEDEPWDGEWTAVVDAGQALADPESPEEPERLIDEFLERDVPDAARGAWLRAAWVAAAIAALVALLRFTPLGDSFSADRMAEWMLTLRDSPLAPVGVVATYVGASLLLVPVTVLIVATALLFPAPWAVTYALVGVLAAALVGFALGRLLGRDVVRRALGGRLNRISRRLARRGALSVAAVRLVPLAPFTLVNAVAGASHLRLRDFVVGTVAGVAPGILAIVLLEASLEEVMRRPDPRSVLALVLVVGVVVLAFALVRRLRPGSRH